GLGAPPASRAPRSTRRPRTGPRSRESRRIPGAARPSASPRPGSRHGAVLENARIERPPQIPGGHRAVGAPALAATQDLPRRREDAGVEGAGESFADAVVAGGKDVRPTQPEDQEHLDGPASDAAGGANGRFSASSSRRHGPTLLIRRPRSGSALARARAAAGPRCGLFVMARMIPRRW